MLLGSRKYSTPVDIWSIGCIFAEMINGNPLFTGTSEDTQLDTIFRHLGTPDESTFPGISELPDWRSDFPNYPPPDSLHVLVPNLEQSGVELLQVCVNLFLLSFHPPFPFPSCPCSLYLCYTHMTSPTPHVMLCPFSQCDTMLYCTMLCCAMLSYSMS